INALSQCFTHACTPCYTASYVAAKMSGLQGYSSPFTPRMIQSPHDTRCCPSSVPIDSVPSPVPASVGYNDPLASRSICHAQCIHSGHSELLARCSGVIWKASITIGFFLNCGILIPPNCQPYNPL